MSNRKYVTTLGLAIALGAPLTALADGFWETTNDEAGSRIVVPQLGAVSRNSAAAPAAPLRVGAISADRQYVFLGEEGGWQLRPMEYRVEGGRLVHVDDPVGHMHRLADSSPLTAGQRAALERGGG